MSKQTANTCQVRHCGGGTGGGNAAIVRAQRRLTLRAFCRCMTPLPFTSPTATPRARPRPSRKRGRAACRTARAAARSQWSHSRPPMAPRAMSNVPTAKDVSARRSPGGPVRIFAPFRVRAVLSFGSLAVKDKLGGTKGADIRFIVQTRRARGPRVSAASAPRWPSLGACRTMRPWRSAPSPPVATTTRPACHSTRTRTGCQWRTVRSCSVLGACAADASHAHCSQRALESEACGSCVWHLDSWPNPLPVLLLASKGAAQWHNGTQNSRLLRAGATAPPPSERTRTVQAWLQHVVARRVSAGAARGASPAMHAAASMSLNAALQSHEQCRHEPYAMAAIVPSPLLSPQSVAQLPRSRHILAKCTICTLKRWRLQGAGRGPIPVPICAGRHCPAAAVCRDSTCGHRVLRAPCRRRRHRGLPGHCGLRHHQRDSEAHGGAFPKRRQSAAAGRHAAPLERAPARSDGHTLPCRPCLGRRQRAHCTAGAVPCAQNGQCACKRSMCVSPAFCV